MENNLYPCCLGRYVQFQNIEHSKYTYSIQSEPYKNVIKSHVQFSKNQRINVPKNFIIKREFSLLVPTTEK